MQYSKLDLYITPKEIAELFNISVQAVHKVFREHNIETRVMNSRHRIYPKVMREVLAIRGLTFPKCNIAVSICKGGTGKTTIASGLASRASMYGIRTLVVDADPQSNLSQSLGVYSKPRVDPTLLDVYTGRMGDRSVKIQDAVIELTDTLSIIPANLSLANLDLALIQGTENIGTFFEQILEPIRDQYDCVFIDTAPSITRISSAANCFADKILLPVNPEPFSLEGLQLSIEHISSIMRKFHKESELFIVLNKFDARAKLSFETMKQLASSIYKDYLCDTPISVTKAFDNSVASHKNIWTGTKNDNTALDDLSSVLSEILNLDSWKSKEKLEQPSPMTEILEGQAILPQVNQNPSISLE